MNIFVWKLSKIAVQKKFFSSFFSVFFGFRSFLTVFFAPTSRSRMCNIFRDLESLGKSNGKKWSQIWTFLFENCLKLPRKKVYSLTFSLLRYHLPVFLPPLPEVGCPIFLEIRNPWGKVMERSGLTFEHFSLEVVYNPRAKKVFFADFALVHPPMASVLLSASVERCLVSCMRDFFIKWHSYSIPD